MINLIGIFIFLLSSLILVKEEAFGLLAIVVASSFLIFFIRNNKRAIKIVNSIF